MPDGLGVPDQGSWVEGWLSQTRFRSYLDKADGDQARALVLYEWNSALSCAVLHDLGHFEVALRNAYATAFDRTWQGSQHWLDDPSSPLRARLYRKRKRRTGRQFVDVNDKLRRAIDDARRKHGVEAAPGKIIAELSFGQWRYLSSASREKTLWVPHLHHAFPSGTSRAEVDAKIGDLHTLRNRAAHWEPLLEEPVADRLSGLLWVAGLLSPNLASYIQRHSQIPALLNNRPS